MTREDKIKRVESLLERVRALHKRAELVYSLFGLGKYGDAVAAVEMCAVASVAELIGDRSGWLEWFIYENAFGAKGLAAKHSDWAEERPIRTVSDLLDIIE